MSRYKWGLFPYDTLDYKAAQAWLDKKSAQGWALDRVYLRLFARFVPAEGRTHCVDLDLNTDLTVDTGDDYLQLCEDAGWELVGKVRRMRLFRSKPGKHPAPIHSDESMESERFWKKLVRKNLIVGIITLLVYLVLLLPVFFSPRTNIMLSELFSANAFLLQIPVVALVTIYLLWSAVFLLRGFIRSRRMDSMSAWTRPAARAMGFVTLAVFILLVGWWCLDIAETAGLGVTVDEEWSHYGDKYTATPELCQSYSVITATDLGLPPSEISRYLDGRRSLLIPDSLNYSEITSNPHHILTTERYECVSESVAKEVFAARRKESSRRNGFIWGPLTWSSVTSDYGFDEVCVTQTGAYLLIRQDNVVALVGATELDLTVPKYLDTIRQRLDLGP